MMDEVFVCISKEVNIVSIALDTCQPGHSPVFTASGFRVHSHLP